MYVNVHLFTNNAGHHSLIPGSIIYVAMEHQFQLVYAVLVGKICTVYGFIGYTAWRNTAVLCILPYSVRR